MSRWAGNPVSQQINENNRQPAVPLCLSTTDWHDRSLLVSLYSLTQPATQTGEFLSEPPQQSGAMT